MSQRRTDLLLMYRGGSSSSEKGVAYPIIVRNTGTGHFWDVELRALHDDSEVDRMVVRRVGPHSESDQVSLLIPAEYCDEGSPGLGLRPRGRTVAEAMLDGQVVASVELPGGTEPPRVDRVPRTLDEEARLLQGRQDGWEYLYFAAVLRRELNALEPKYRDHEIGFAAPQPGPVLDVQECLALISAAHREVLTLIGNVERIFSPAAKDSAFGPLGEPGDPERIEHLASRIIAVYEGLLDWTARIRGTPVDENFVPAVNVLSRFVGLPIVQFREFVEKVVADMDRLPAILSAEDETPVTLTLVLNVEMEPGLVEEWAAEMQKLERHYS